MSKRTRLKINRVPREPNPNWNNTPIPRSYEGSPLDTFDKAIATITKERGEQYGHPAVDFGRIATLHTVTTQCPDPRLRVALNMIAVKLSRLVESPNHLDSWIDIAGYARTAVMIMQREHVMPDTNDGD